MPNKMERFTDGARIIFNLSQEIAENLHHEYIEPEHMLLAMARVDKTNAFHTLDDMDIIDAKLTPYIKSMPFSTLRTTGILSDRVKKALELSVDTARKHGYPHIDTTHLLIGIIRIDSPTINQILEHFNVQKKDLIKRAEYYSQYTLEKRMGLKDFEAEYNQNVGCFEATKRQILWKFRKKKNDE